VSECFGSANFERGFMNAGQQTVEWVHAGIAEWMRPVISMAAALQVSEANALWHLLKDFLPAHENTSVPPQSGLRNTPDEIAEIVSSWVQPLGQQPCKWQPREFKDAVSQYMQGPPSLMANSDGAEFIVEFPYDGISSLCRQHDLA